jgi:hypothetical protein
MLFYSWPSSVTRGHMTAQDDTIAANSMQYA